MLKTRVTVFDWYYTMAENAQLADDEKTLRANIAAERGVAQNAAANDNITFDDEYVKIKNGHLRYWFVCMAGDSERPCMSAMLPNTWCRKFADPSASRNKWKCTFCNSNYRTKWGVFVEVTIDGTIYCIRSTVPDDDTLYIKSMDLERKRKDTSTAQALYNAIPMIAPTETQYVHCVDSEKGQYSLISKRLYMDLPQRHWSDVLTLSFA